MEAYGYVRVSTQYQKEQNNLEIQKEKIIRYCDDKGIKLKGIFSDVRSGLNRNIKNTNLNKALKLCLKSCNMLIVTHPDRLTRNVEVFDRVVNRNIKFCAIFRDGASIKELRKDIELAQREPQLMKERRRMQVDKLEKEIKMFKYEKIYKNINTCGFDIETTSLSGKTGKVKIISLVVDNGNKYLFIYPKCQFQIPGCQTLFFQTEKHLITKFFNVVKMYLPLVIHGFNSARFDWRFLKERCKELEIDINPFRFAKISGYNYITKDCPNKSLITNIDLKVFSQRFLQESNCSLNSISKKYIGETKLPFSKDKLLYCLRNNKNMKELALYCLQDSQLLLKLDLKFRSYEKLLDASNELNIAIPQFLSHKKCFYHCLFSEIVMDTLNNVYDKTSSLSECNRLLKMFLNNLNNGSVDVSSLYYYIPIKADHFDEKSIYKTLVSQLKKKGGGRIGELAYFTYSSKEIIPFDKNTVSSTIDSNKVFKKSLKNPLIKFYESRSNLNISKFLNLTKLMRYLEGCLKCDVHDNNNFDEADYIHIADISDLILRKTSEDIQRKYPTSNTSSHKISYIYRTIYYADKLLSMFIELGNLEDIDEIKCYFPESASISNLCQTLQDFMEQVGVQIYGEEDIKNKRKLRKTAIEDYLNTRVNKTYNNTLIKKLQNFSIEYRSHIDEKPDHPVSV